MKRILLLLPLFFLQFSFHFKEKESEIRINLIGYSPQATKNAVWCSFTNESISSFLLVDSASGKTIYQGVPSQSFGAYGPFRQTARLDFSSITRAGRYYLQTSDARSPCFSIGSDVYAGMADFCLRYLRQQRCGFNPFLHDSCHTHDGYTLYAQPAGIPDSTHIDVTGGWHDASDYLQYVTTSANATYHLLMAYRDFPSAFADEKLANGLDGRDNLPDVLDEANWGLAWLQKMFPRKDLMFAQVADDRDHISMRIPKEDSQYGRGYERPVYFVSGEPQQRGKFMNDTKGTSSVAGKFASTFALAQSISQGYDAFRKQNRKDDAARAADAFAYGLKKPGATQTVSVRSPYIYAEDNWTDDMELAGAALYSMNASASTTASNHKYLQSALDYATKEKITPWFGQDTARHYQWYPFINLGHYELARILQRLSKNKKGSIARTQFDTITGFYREGIERVWNKAKHNAFYRGIPFIWCSNNLTVSFAIQCYWYRQLTGDASYQELEQACFDWILGCNPWGTSMVYGLPAWGDTPTDPHSAFSHIRHYPVDGALVDGPVYTNIYKNLIGISLGEPDEYADFQSDLAVYHDDYGDYSTNEPTMDGTASLVYLLAMQETQAHTSMLPNSVMSHGGIIRGDSTQHRLSLVFTGHDQAGEAAAILKVLHEENVQASFFLTGSFYRNKQFRPLVKEMMQNGHYLGAHSNAHVLYCDWTKRDSLLVTKQEFIQDLHANYAIMDSLGIATRKSKYFLPAYEWYNDSIAAWTNELGLQLVNFTPGTRSNADYTWPDLDNYKSSADIYRSITEYEQRRPNGLNGFILLLHIGTDPRRTDKFSARLKELIHLLKSKGYQLQTIDGLLSPH